MTCEQKNAIKYLNTAKGQIEGILKMIDERRYCIDVSNQISAANALLKKANVDILQGHLNTCLKDAIEKGEDIENKMKEIHDVMLRMSK